MFVGSFAGDFDGFQSDVVSAITSFKAAGITQLLIDLTNNGGKDELVSNLAKARSHWCRRGVHMSRAFPASVPGWEQYWLSVCYCFRRCILW